MAVLMLHNHTNSNDLRRAKWSTYVGVKDRGAREQGAS